MPNLVGNSSDPTIAAVQGTQTGNGGTGVLGTGPANGVIGQSSGNGFSGVFGESATGPGVSGSSTSSVGVDAKTQSGPAALRAIHAGDGVGVLGACHGNGFSGVFGESATGPGVSGSSTSSVGVDAKTQSGPAALRAVHAGGGLAGLFEGDVEVTGDIRLANADCAEDFDVSGAVKVEPGTVMVLGNEGALSESHQAYDKRVAGVISGAGGYKPGIVLDKQQTSGNRQPIALMGKVFCKVDAQYGAIEVGDLLTTSDTPGHAMKTTDPMKAFGAVIGKALRPLKDRQGIIPILIALQ
ncbi:MAG: hypothetical protein H0U97_10780 [Gammaproteobacteria bacterium]|nr:hypothetical protein [Gammaproteobacteria bacterium]